MSAYTPQNHTVSPKVIFDWVLTDQKKNCSTKINKNKNNILQGKFFSI
jgi:hypothetical protein